MVECIDARPGRACASPKTSHNFAVAVEFEHLLHTQPNDGCSVSRFERGLNRPSGAAAKREGGTARESRPREGIIAARWASIALGFRRRRSSISLATDNQSARDLRDFPDDCAATTKLKRMIPLQPACYSNRMSRQSSLDRRSRRWAVSESGDSNDCKRPSINIGTWGRRFGHLPTRNRRPVSFSDGSVTCTMCSTYGPIPAASPRRRAT
jgi:hypothetical protein